MAAALAALIARRGAITRPLARGFAGPSFGYVPDDPPRPPRVVRSNGLDLIHDPLINKGSAFTLAERERLKLRGLLPPRVNSIEAQSSRFLEELRYGPDYIDPNAIEETGIDSGCVRKWKALTALLDRNETLFYSVLVKNFAELAPLVYTPTVGWASLNHHLISQRPRGMVFSADDAGCFAPILWNWPAKEVDAIVLTDGSRVLGLGDLGANGLAISIGKLNLYCAAAGFHPSRVLPIVLDVGTDNKTLRADPAYGGLARERLTGDAYFALLDELVTALTTRYPKAVLQFEDFSTDVASIALERYRSHHLTFNDDIQGTAATAVAGLHGALKANGLPSQALTDQKIVVVGAGSAGLGVVRMVAASMRALGAAPAAAAARFWVLDAHGLVTRARGTFLDPAVAPFARPAGGGDVEGENLLDVVSRVKPDVLIGLSGAGRLFTPAVLAALSAGVPDGRRPVVMPLSNPQSRMECLAADAAAATGGRAIFASGSPQADVNLPGGGVMRSSQANNMYVFPGLALGAFLGETGAVTDAMLAAAAEALPALIDPADSAEGAIYPKLSAIREISTQVAAAVMRAADSEGRVGSAPARAALAAGATALEAHIKNRMYNPVYKPLIRLPVGVME